MAMRTDSSQGLESRFEALSKFDKAPNTPGGVRAKALTPLSQPFKFSRFLRLVIGWNHNISYLGQYTAFHYLYIFGVSNDNV
ncbi:hypothetical protein CPR19088_GLDEOEPO_00612 [Companilactobacillus paralimentarius]|nr:hypothetical protein LNA01_09340 [Companilactobacillus nantensis]